MKYGKLIDGALYPAPTALTVQGRVHYNPPGELYAQLGWLPVEDRPYPQTSEDEEAAVYYEAQWLEYDGRIIKTWVQTQPPEPQEPVPTLDERVGALEESSAETREALEMILQGVTE